MAPGSVFDLAVVGAGPAGLGAAIQSASLGAQVVVVDENHQPGGQLFKQIHKFFGSKQHYAGMRGYEIGYYLLERAKHLGVQVKLNSTVYNLYREPQAESWHVCVSAPQGLEEIRAKKLLLAAGATENALAFPGWTLPGVMLAGAVQTMVNIYRVLPGRRFLMVGSGNVGLIVTYQLLQAGAEVAALLEAAPRIGGYEVHAAKIRRWGVPILLSHTIKEAKGTSQVEAAVIHRLDSQFRPVPGTERILDVDAICIAVGLTPATELARLVGCRMHYIPQLGGHIPIHDANMQTTVPGVYVAGDIAGVEEASTALEEGRLAGVAVAESLGYLETRKAKQLAQQIHARLAELRSGPMGEHRRRAKEQIVTLAGDAV